MSEVEARAALAQLIRERGDDFASLSRLIGRNPAYVQQYIKRGSPKRLDEQDRRLLARYFGVPETLLGAPEPEAAPDGIAVPRLDIGASAGPGSLPGQEAPRGHVTFEAAWLRRLVPGSAAQLSMIRVEGDSMEPTLADGDEIFVDRGDCADRLRDGIYVLRLDDALIVKRVALNPATRRLSISSDNPAYPGWPDCDQASVDIVGRVVWAGRKIA
jgi:phage repressor protein C with HTH and peptisase S24 domain